jgi:uncharacterized membrane protein YoaK (UPF0700 family)
MAAAIAFVAGYVDAIGFVGFGGMFVSFMSGNSTRIGAGAAAIDLRAVLLTASVIALFVIGVAVGQALGGTRDQVRQRRVLFIVSAALAIAALAAMFAGPFPAILAAAFAMGAINTVFASSPLPVGLTYMTGTLVKLGQSLGQRWRGANSPAAWPYLVHWLALVSGALIGALAFSLWAFAALWMAAAALALLAAGTSTISER